MQNRKKPKNKTPLTESTCTPVLSANTSVEEYTPSSNADKYNVKTPTYSYRIISHANDYVKLQEEITKLLNEGWLLAGGLCTAIHADQYHGTTVFSQAVYKLS